MLGFWECWMFAVGAGVRHHFGNSRRGGAVSCLFGSCKFSLVQNRRSWRVLAFFVLVFIRDSFFLGCCGGCLRSSRCYTHQTPGFFGCDRRLYEGNKHIGTWVEFSLRFGGSHWHLVLIAADFPCLLSSLFFWPPSS